MKPYITPLVAISMLLAFSGRADTGSPFYGDAPDEHHPWAVHDRNRPQPAIVTPGNFRSQDQPGTPPSDAVVLFDGRDLSQWESDGPHGGPTKWNLTNGIMESVPHSGSIKSKDKFGDCQLHVEWAELPTVQGTSQGRGNSGVFLMGLVEIQVLDNYNNPTYPDGAAGSIYSVNPPLVNPLRPPGEFQTYDIIFRRPIYKDGNVLDPGYVTVFLNGVLVQDHTRLEGPTDHRIRSKPGPFPETGPLKLQEHGGAVRYRNIWYRPLPPNPIEGGTDGYLTADATLAKRAEIAATIRQDARKLKNSTNSVPEMLRWAESLVYQKDTQALAQMQQLADEYLSNLQKLDAEKLALKKNQITYLRDVYRYLVRNNVIAADTTEQAQLEQIVKEHNWDAKPAAASGH